MNSNQNLKLVLLAFVLLTFIWGCKSTKKTSAVTDAAAEKNKMEQEANLRKQKEDELKKKEAEENERRKAELALSVMKENAPKVKLSEYFNAIANANNVTSANGSINEALTMFASADVPVLIVISDEAGQKDYDRPTTIKAYLNYLKDQKKNLNSIESLKVDGAGKITEVELKKNN